MRWRKLVEVSPTTMAFHLSASAHLFCWIFIVFSAVPIAIGVTASGFEQLFLLAIGGCCLLVMAVVYRESRKPIVFDRLQGYCWKGKSLNQALASKKRKQLKVALGEVAGVQILRKVVRGSKGGSYPCGELNLVLRNHERVHVLVSGNVDLLAEEARKLASWLGTPIVASPDFVEETRDWGDFTLPGRVDVPSVRKRAAGWSVSRFLFSYLLPVISVGVGGWVLWGAVQDYQSGRASKEWPATDGVVIRTEIQESSGNSKKTYLGRVYYRYTVDGNEYKSNQRRFGDNVYSSNHASAVEVTRNYPKGKKVEVFYDPQQPSVAVLERGYGREMWIAVFVGFVFTCIGVSMLPRSYRRSQKGSTD